MGLPQFGLRKATMQNRGHRYCIIWLPEMQCHSIVKAMSSAATREWFGWYATPYHGDRLNQLSGGALPQRKYMVVGTQGKIEVALHQASRHVVPHLGHVSYRVSLPLTTQGPPGYADSSPTPRSTEDLVIVLRCQIVICYAITQAMHTTY